ncbi:hypothetical protein NK6_3605 [Bradyrhizobium diazoefficiens]|uniref:Uncharacterized protein n=1 Tax=Bradyrhizobium diazoefficiens TaxID=1355477 RepID=A0A0E4FTI8_9BRAD|nr:hypothetical protein NK6_3605 [Bradyrhizobium diazoefficiens]
MNAGGGHFNSSLPGSAFPSPLVGEGGASRSEATGEGYVTAWRALQECLPAQPRAVATPRCSSNALWRNLPRTRLRHELRRLVIPHVGFRQSRSRASSRNRQSRECSS